MGQKSRITPVEPPTKNAGLVRKNTVRADVKIKREFDQPLNVKRLPHPTGPKLQGYICAASWEVITDDDQTLRFLMLEDQLKNTQRLFHGTPAVNIGDIVQMGLRPGKWGMFGAGIYTGGIGKAINYAHGFGAHYVLEVDVILGKVKECLGAEKWAYKRLLDAGFNSVGGFANLTSSWGGKLRHNEYVVYDREQVLIQKVHEYQRDYSIAATYPTQGACNLIVEKDIVPTKGLRTFKDVLAKQPCGKIAYRRCTTKVTNTGPFDSIWICNNCLEKYKIRIGSKVEARFGTYQLRNQIITITG